MALDDNVRIDSIDGDIRGRERTLRNRARILLCSQEPDDNFGGAPKGRGRSRRLVPRENQRIL